MCQFFSFVTDPVGHLAEYYYFDWEYRKANLNDEGVDSHSHICAHFNLNEDRCNKYEFNPLTKAFRIDQINSERDDSEAAEKWVKRLDFKTVIEPLIVKPIVNPLGLPKVEQVTDEQIGWLKVWASVGDSVRASVWDSVWDSVGASVRDSVLDSVGASVRAYISSFFAVEYNHDLYNHDLSSAIALWESGLLPSFDGTTWRLHSGKKAEIVYEWKKEVE